MPVNSPFHNLKELHEVPRLRDAAPVAGASAPQAAPPMQQMPPPQMQQPCPQAPQPYYDQRHGHDDKHGYDSHGYPRKKSVWQELFD